MSSLADCSIPAPTEAPFGQIVFTATFSTLLVGFDGSVTAQAVGGALFLIEPPKNF